MQHKSQNSSADPSERRSNVQSAASPTASTRSGLVRGVLVAASTPHRRERDVAVFRGIPFAADTGGVNRFCAPQREQLWTGERDATSFGTIAPQSPTPLEAMFGAAPTSVGEDCLNLNVWTPRCDDAARPVLVWIHGGGFMTGSGSTPWYDGTRYAANHDVVVVSINYRMGAFGYLHLAGVSANEPNSQLDGELDAMSSNCGLLDQIAALQWVRDCIASFGGDPAQVTVFGESAGAMSIGTLLGTPASKGLFARAILESGAAGNVGSSEVGAETARSVLEEAGFDADGIGFKALRAMSTSELLKVSDAVGNRIGVTGRLPFQPTVDGRVLPRHPLEEVRAGAAAGIEVLFGTTRDEMRLFTLFDTALTTVTRDGLVKRAELTLGTRAASVIDTYIAARAGQPMSEVWPDVATDMVFRAPAQRLAEALASRAGASMWAYEFHWPSPAFGGRLKSCHALEIPFVFDNLDKPGIEMFTGAGAERQDVADLLHTAWANFARSGDPNVGAALPGPAWPVFDVKTRPVYHVDAVSSVDDDPRGDELRLWLL